MTGKQRTKFQAVLVCFIYFTTNCAFAQSVPLAGSWWAERHASHLNKDPIEPANPSVRALSVNQIFFNDLVPPGRISARFGNFEKTAASLTSTSMRVIHIKDIHGNSEAQSNIAEALSELAKNENIGFIALEGSSRELQFSSYQAYPHQDSVRAAANFLLKGKRISGPVYWALQKSAPNIPLFGIDDPEHYAKNVNAYLASLKTRPQAKKIFEELAAQIELEKAKTLNPSLRELDRAMEAYRSGKLTLLAHLNDLEKASGELGPELIRLQRALNFEMSLNPALVKSERASLLKALSQKLDSRGAQKLLNLTLSYKQATISNETFYRSLDAISRANGVFFHRFPALEAFSNYVLLSEELDAQKVEEELLTWEHRAADKKIRTDSERSLMNRSEYLFLEGKLADYALTRREWEIFQKLDQQLAKTALSYSEVLQPFKDFYREAEIRDERMTERFISLARQKRCSVAVLVTGGFHSKGIDDRLVQAGFKPEPFVPRITRTDLLGKNDDLSRFAQEKTPLEKLVQGEKLFLARDPAQGMEEAPFDVLACDVHSGYPTGDRSLQSLDEELPVGLKVQLRLHGTTVDEIVAGRHEEVEAEYGFYGSQIDSLHWSTGLHWVKRLQSVLSLIGVCCLFIMRAKYGILGLTLWAGILGVVSTDGSEPVIPLLRRLREEVAMYKGARRSAESHRNPSPRLENIKERMQRVQAAKERWYLPYSTTDLIEATKFLKGSAQFGPLTDEKIGRCVSIFSVAVKKALATPDLNPLIRAYIGGEPNEKQIEGAISLLENRTIASMLPSEGKTLTVALASFIKVMMGQKVEIHDWSTHLAERDAQVSGAIFSQLGLKVGAYSENKAFVFNPAASTSRLRPHLESLAQNETQAERVAKTRILFHEMDVVYGPHDQMIFTWMEDWFGIKGEKFHYRPYPDWVIAEEADSLLIDDAQDPLVLCRRSYYLNEIRQRMLREIFAFTENSMKLGRDFIFYRGHVVFKNRRRKDAVLARLHDRLSGQAALRNLTDDNGVDDLLLAALEARYLLRKGRDYTVESGRAYIRNTTNGEIRMNQKWGRSIHSFIEIKEDIPILPEAKADSLMSSLFYYRLIPHWSAVNGVLDDETAADFEWLHSVSIHEVKPKYQSTKTVLRPAYTRTKAQKWDRLVKMMEKLVATGRPILINAMDPNEVHEIYQKFSTVPSLRGRLQVVDARRNGHSQINQIGEPHTITLSAQIASRGHEIKIAEPLYEWVDVEGIGRVGGLLVLSTHRGPSPRLEKQVIDRSGRGGRSGFAHIMDHIEGNEFLERYAPEYLEELLQDPSLDAANPATVETIDALFELAQLRRSREMGLARANAERDFEPIITSALQFTALASRSVISGDDWNRFFITVSDFVQEAYQAMSIRSREQFSTALERIRSESVFLSRLHSVTGLERFSHQRPLDNFSLLCRFLGVTEDEVYLEIDPEKRLRRGHLEVFPFFVDYFVNYGYRRDAIRSLLGYRKPQDLLLHLQGRPIPEVLATLRTSRWMTQAQLTEALAPNVVPTTYQSWEQGSLVPTLEDLNHVAAFYADSYGFDYTTLCAVMGIPTGANILDALGGQPLPTVLNGLRNASHLSPQDVATELGVTPETVNGWERDVRPQASNIRRLIELYGSKRNFGRNAVRQLMGLRSFEQIAAEAAGKTSYQLLIELMESVPNDKKELTEILEVSFVTLQSWEQTGVVPPVHLRTAATHFSQKHGYSRTDLFRILGIKEDLRALSELEGKPLGAVIKGLRTITGEKQEDLARALNVDPGLYKRWEGSTRAPRFFRQRLVTHYKIRHNFPEKTLRSLLDIQTPEEMIALTANKPLRDVLTAFRRRFDYSKRQLYMRLGLEFRQYDRLEKDGVPGDDLLNRMTEFFANQHRFDLKQIKEHLETASAIQARGDDVTIADIGPNASAHPIVNGRIGVLRSRGDFKLSLPEFPGYEIHLIGNSSDLILDSTGQSGHAGGLSSVGSDHPAKRIWIPRGLFEASPSEALQVVRHEIAELDLWWKKAEALIAAGKVRPSDSPAPLPTIREWIRRNVNQSRALASLYHKNAAADVAVSSLGFPRWLIWFTATFPFLGLFLVPVLKVMVFHRSHSGKDQTLHSQTPEDHLAKAYAVLLSQSKPGVSREDIHQLWGELEILWKDLDVKLDVGAVAGELTLLPQKISGNHSWDESRFERSLRKELAALGAGRMSTAKARTAVYKATLSVSTPVPLDRLSPSNLQSLGLNIIVVNRSTEGDLSQLLQTLMAKDELSRSETVVVSDFLDPSFENRVRAAGAQFLWNAFLFEGKLSDESYRLSFGSLERSLRNSPVWEKIQAAGRISIFYPEVPVDPSGATEKIFGKASLVILLKGLMTLRTNWRALKEMERISRTIADQA